MSLKKSDSEGEVEYVYLPNGRKIAFLEKGCKKTEEKVSILVLHGLGSSRLANMPGISDELLKEFGVRLISIDRAGYGRSDPDYNLSLKSAAYEISHIGDLLEMGDKFWLLGYSGGGAYCWASANYIPGRIKGIALWAPVGNYHWMGIENEDRAVMFSHTKGISRWLLTLGGTAPGWVTRTFVKNFVVPSSGTPWLRRCQKNLSLPDRKHLEDPHASIMMVRDNLESLAAGNNGAGMAKDLEIFNSPWGFELSDISRRFPGPIHIWQGSEDWLVPLSLQKHIKRQLPEIVQLHELSGEGHLSWFCFNEENHRKVLSTLFGDKDKRDREDEREGKGREGKKGEGSSGTSVLGNSNDGTIDNTIRGKL